MNEKKDNKWYVLKVRPRHEKAIASRLSEQYEVYLPLITKKSQWADRVKEIELPLFPGYLFVNTDYKNKYYIIEKQGVSSFVEFGNNPAIIRESEIQAIKIMTKNAPGLQVEDSFGYSKGEEVVIMRGAFAGMKGIVNVVKNKLRLYILIEQLGKAVSVEIDKDSIKKQINRPI